eukprot:scaffold1557_cov108-Isochrysis_galbana.AAC.12
MQPFAPTTATVPPPGGGALHGELAKVWNWLPPHWVVAATIEARVSTEHTTIAATPLGESPPPSCIGGAGGGAAIRPPRAADMSSRPSGHAASARVAETAPGMKNV